MSTVHFDSMQLKDWPVYYSSQFILVILAKIDNEILLIKFVNGLHWTSQSPNNIRNSNEFIDFPETYENHST